MKNYYVKATRDFTDLLEQKSRTKNEKFYCTEARYNEFIKHNKAVELIEIISDKKEEKIEETDKKKNKKKK